MNPKIREMIADNNELIRFCHKASAEYSDIFRRYLKLRKTFGLRPKLRAYLRYPLYCKLRCRFFIVKAYIRILRLRILDFFI